MEKEKVCFVLMGYGVKVDYASGRKLDLDKTYEHLIKPVFDSLSIKCFRASDIRHSGVIDTPMYEYIQKADIVVADVSTLNPNAIYELGVRHALRPHTTIVIAEKEMPYPFDLNHTTITTYKHLGEDIGVSEAKRFKEEFRLLVEELIRDPKKDSPVYTYLPNLQPPTFTQQELQELQEVAEDTATVGALLSSAGKAMKDLQYERAKHLLETALDYSPNDVYIRQQLALATYKARKPSVDQALHDAEQILSILNPERTTDTETLGLLGAICKRRYELSGQEEDLSKAINFYSRGFLLAKDYYNGINLSLLLLKKALTEVEPVDAVTDIRLAQRVRELTMQYCLALMDDQFDERPDKVWVLLTLAEVEFANGRQRQYEDYVRQAERLAEGKFENTSFQEQMTLLKPTLQATTRILEEWYKRAK